MIDLTPLEVRKKKGDFRKGMRGYDPQSVDDFLDVVADRLEQLVRDNAGMLERMKRAEEQVSDYRERERALTEALVTAQEMREEMRKQIGREVELKRREAEADAENIRNEAIQMREREEESIRRLRARQSQFVQSYRAFLERELTELAVMSESLDFSRTVNPPAPTRRTRKRAESAEPIAPVAPVAPIASVPEPEPEMAQFEPETPFEPESTLDEDLPFEPESLFEPETPAEAELPLESQPSSEPQTSAPNTFDRGLPFGDEAPIAPASASEPVPMPLPIAEPDEDAPTDRSIDDLLAGFTSGQPAQLEIGTPTEAVQEADTEAELLADVRAEFDEIAADEPLPGLLEDEDVLDLVDDVAADEDADGWVSTLLEGKGDERRK